MLKTEIYKRLYKDYTKKYLDKIILSALFSILVAGSTSAIAWLLDPAIKKLFIEKDQSLIFFMRHAPRRSKMKARYEGTRTST